MRQKLQKNNQGFTIIEVLIVLAIAALILLIVFLAVPALQRSARNNGRKNDAGRIGAAINDYVSNNSGNLPGAVGGAGGTADLTAVMTGVGTPSQFTNNAPAAAAGAPAGGASNVFDWTTAATPFTVNAPLPTPGGNVLYLDEQVTCGTSTGTTGAGTTRSAALFYSLEAGSSWTWGCFPVQ